MDISQKENEIKKDESNNNENNNNNNNENNKTNEEMQQQENNNNNNNQSNNISNSSIVNINELNQNNSKLESSNNNNNNNNNNDSKKEISNPNVTILSPEDKFIPKNIIFLSDISTYTKNINLYIKIIKICEVKPFFNKHTYKDGKLLSFDIMDSKGNEMQANIFDETIDKLIPYLNVGDIYYIQGGYAKISEKIYTNIKSDYKIIFDLNTKFTKINKNNDIIFYQKKENINIIPFIDLIKFQKNSVVDCIAYVLEANKTTIKPSKNGTDIKIRRILLCDFSKKKISMTLWKKFCEIDIEKGNILLLKYIRVTEYNGICLTTIDDSNIIVNPRNNNINLKELDLLEEFVKNGINENELSFINKYGSYNSYNNINNNNNFNNENNFLVNSINNKGNDNNNNNINNNNINNNNNENNNNINNINNNNSYMQANGIIIENNIKSNSDDKLISINELLNLLKPNENNINNTYPFNIKVTVCNLNHSNKNYFCGCPNKSCRKKISKINETEWYCQACKEKYNEPYYYYTVSLRIKDLTGEHFVDLFGDTVTTLFGIKAEEYNNYIENNDIEKLYEISNNIEYQKFYFSGKASIQKYNNRIKKQFFVYRFEKVDYKIECFKFLDNILRFMNLQG